MNGRSPRRAFAALAVAASLSVIGAACAVTSAPEVGEGADDQLVEGRSIWASSCASCHGSSGGGGRGTRLNGGRVTDRFPDIQNQIDLVANGRGAMPGYSGRLTEEQIEGVVRYTREILAPID